MEPALALLLSCSLHLDDPLLLGVMEAFSTGNPYRVENVALLDEEDERLGLETPPQSAAEARAAVDRITAAGGEPVIGLLPLRPEWLAELDQPEAGLFDPCQQVRVASAKISEFDYQCRRRGAAAHTRARRACTLRRYGASLGLPALGRFVMLTLEQAPSPPSISLPANVVDDSLFRPGGIFLSNGTP